jgi:hypothetical protein
MRRLAGWAVLAGLLATAAVAGGAGDDEWVQDSRDAAKQLGATLMGELTAALQTSPVEAIDVCKLRAPGIAAELGEQAGARIGRTALRVRNPANAPTDWQRDVLESFAASLAAGADAASLEHVEVAETGGVTERRWMKPIMTAPLCLTCHGGQIPAGIAQALSVAYPEDQATGFEAGQLRGAFYVVWRESAPK